MVERPPPGVTSDPGTGHSLIPSHPPPLRIQTSLAEYRQISTGTPLYSSGQLRAANIVGGVTKIIDEHTHRNEFHRLIDFMRF